MANKAFHLLFLVVGLILLSQASETLAAQHHFRRNRKVSAQSQLIQVDWLLTSPVISNVPANRTWDAATKTLTACAGDVVEFMWNNTGVSHGVALTNKNNYDTCTIAHYRTIAKVAPTGARKIMLSRPSTYYFYCQVTTPMSHCSLGQKIEVVVNRCGAGAAPKPAPKPVVKPAPKPVPMPSHKPQSQLIQVDWLLTSPVISNVPANRTWDAATKTLTACAGDVVEFMWNNTGVSHGVALTNKNNYDTCTIAHYRTIAKVAPTGARKIMLSRPSTYYFYCQVTTPMSHCSLGQKIEVVVNRCGAGAAPKPAPKPVVKPAPKPVPMPSHKPQSQLIQVDWLLTSPVISNVPANRTWNAATKTLTACAGDVVEFMWNNTGVSHGVALTNKNNYDTCTIAHYRTIAKVAPTGARKIMLSRPSTYYFYCQVTTPMSHCSLGQKIEVVVSKTC